MLQILAILTPYHYLFMGDFKIKIRNDWNILPLVVSDKLNGHKYRNPFNNENGI